MKKTFLKLANINYGTRCIIDVANALTCTPPSTGERIIALHENTYNFDVLGGKLQSQRHMQSIEVLFRPSEMESERNVAGKSHKIVFIV